MEAFSSAAIDPLREEWFVIADREADSIEEWADRIPMLASEYLDIRSRGAWVSGPGDLLGVLGLDRAELFHSRLVAWLLDPEGRHGLGRRFIDALLAECFPDLGIGQLRVRSIELEVTRLETRADIIVWGDMATVVVETKVNAGEGHRQCDRLFERFGDEVDPRFLFLTPRGRSPVTATGEARASFVPLSFRRLGDLLEMALNGVQEAEAADIARSYLRTIRKEFG